jgi:hypothetical protein
VINVTAPSKNSCTIDGRGPYPFFFFCENGEGKKLSKIENKGAKRGLPVKEYKLGKIK